MGLHSSESRSTEVAVIGGGPAGSTVAIRLRQLGHDVTVFEKAHHPRFHIGESLLPYNMALFERLGVAAEMRAIGMPKFGAEFISPWHDHTQRFEFGDGWNKSLGSAYQVRRSQFDEILIRRARACGARVFEGCRVRAVELGGTTAQVHAEHEDGRTETWQARFLVDASGRDTFLGSKLNAKHRNPRHASSAMYAHFKGAWRAGEPRQAGNISIFWFEHGWLWFIPLLDGATSVGAVVWPYYMKGRDRPLQQFFLDTLELCPPLAERLAGAELISPVEATGNYAYDCDRSYGDNYLLIGDAYAFIDPMFSSGVLLAMHSGVDAAEVLHTCLTDPHRKARALRRFDRTMRRGPEAYKWFIYRITNPTMRDMFMAPRNVLRMKEALLSLLAGDIFGATPIGPSLRAFKSLYYLFACAHASRSWTALRRRHANIRPVESDQMAAS